MRKPDKVLKVFAFLKRKFGDKFAAGDLLAFAQELTRQKTNIDRDDRALEKVRKRKIFPFIATDDALSDGGWKLLEFERHSGSGLVDETDNEDYKRHKSIRDLEDE